MRTRKVADDQRLVNVSPKLNSLIRSPETKQKLSTSSTVAAHEGYGNVNRGEPLSSLKQTPLLTMRAETETVYRP